MNRDIDCKVIYCKSNISLHNHKAVERAIDYLSDQRVDDIPQEYRETVVSFITDYKRTGQYLLDEADLIIELTAKTKINKLLNQRDELRAKAQQVFSY